MSSVHHRAMRCRALRSCDTTPERRFRQFSSADAAVGAILAVAVAVAVAVVVVVVVDAASGAAEEAVVGVEEVVVVPLERLLQSESSAG
jgi:hypothetical protein